jgi:hypothetical protein
MQILQVRFNQLCQVIHCTQSKLQADHWSFRGQVAFVQQDGQSRLQSICNVDAWSHLEHFLDHIGLFAAAGVI